MDLPHNLSQSRKKGVGISARSNAQKGLGTRPDKRLPHTGGCRLKEAVASIEFRHADNRARSVSFDRAADRILVRPELFGENGVHTHSLLGVRLRFRKVSSRNQWNVHSCKMA